MSILFPDVGVKKLQWLSAASQYHQKNPMADGGRVFDWGGFVRKAQVATGVLNPGEHEQLTAFVLRVGTQHPFDYTDLFLQSFRGDTTSAVSITTRAVNGFNTQGWPVNTVVAYAGDYLSVGGRLYTLVENASSDASGNSFLTVSPRTLPSVDSGTAVLRGGSVIGTFRLASSILPEISSPFVSTGVTLNLVEVL